MRRLILYLFTSVFIISCNDHLKIEKNDDPQGYADSQFVGSWKVTALNCDVAYDWNNDGTTERDIYSTWSPCEKDNLYTFTADTATDGYKKGTFKINCSVTKTGQWQIVRSDNPKSQSLVYIPLNLLPESEIVIDMTSVQFQSVLLLTLNGLPATITKTWTRQ